MPPVAIAVVCVIVAVLIVVGVIRFIARSNRKMYIAHRDVERAETRADAAERTAEAAELRREEATELASTAVASTAEAVHVGRKIDAVETTVATVSAQLGELLEYVAEAAKMLQPAARGRHHGRHALPAEAPLAIASSDQPVQGSFVAHDENGHLQAYHYDHNGPIKRTETGP